MKVILVNGSLRGRLCTFTALSEVAEMLNKEGIATEFFHLSEKKLVSGCTGCDYCKAAGRCAIDDCVNEFAELADSADGFVFGSPVYFSGPTGTLIEFMNRVFRLKKFVMKPACAVVSCRRGGAATALAQIDKYFSISHMPIVSSQYWNIVHGNTPEEVKRDAEGLQTMRSLALNMAFLLKSIDIAKKSGLKLPQYEKPIKTNFIMPE